MPTEYSAVLLGSGTTLDELGVYRPQEESTPEGSYIMMELSFDSAVSQDAVDYINQQCAGLMIPPWPNNQQYASLDSTGQTLTITWIKGLAFMPIIIGILVLTVLPVLLGALLWWIIPQDIKNMIDMVVMILVMMLMFKMLGPMLSSGGEKKQVKG